MHMLHNLPCHTIVFKLLGDLCKKQKEPTIYQWKTEPLLKPNVLKVSVRKEKYAFAVAA